MKWCLSGRQNQEYLKKADEIIVDWMNNKTVFDIIEINPNARIIVRPSKEQELNEENYQWLIEQKIICRDNFAVAVRNNQQAIDCKKHGLTWFFSYPCQTFLQLNYAQAMGASDAYITDELCHNLETIKQSYPNIQIRVVANSVGTIVMSDNKYLDGMCGGWFRPEDLWQNPYIDIAEFEVQQIKNKDYISQEQALYRIYAESHEWNGKVEDYVYNLKRKNLMNGLFNFDFQAYRNNCGMKCVKYNRCHFCETYAKFVSNEMAQKIKNHIKDSDKNDDV